MHCSIPDLSSFLLPILNISLSDCHINRFLALVNPMVVNWNLPLRLEAHQDLRRSEPMYAQKAAVDVWHYLRNRSPPNQLCLLLLGPAPSKGALSTFSIHGLVVLNAKAVVGLWVGHAVPIFTDLLLLIIRYMGHRLIELSLSVSLFTKSAGLVLLTPLSTSCFVGYNVSGKTSRIGRGSLLFSKRFTYMAVLNCQSIVSGSFF